MMSSCQVRVIAGNQNEITVADFASSLPFLLMGESEVADHDSILISAHVAKRASFRTRRHALC